MKDPNRSIHRFGQCLPFDNIRAGKSVFPKIVFKTFGKFFDDLRKNYSVRREFQNTEVILAGSYDSLAAKLAGIGFKVTNA